MLEDMVDVMRQVIPKKKKSDKNHNNNGNGNNKSDQSKGQDLESSNTQTTKGSQSDDACYACGDKACRLWKCEKKDKIPHKDWHQPKFAPKSSENKGNVKVENHTCVTKENRNTIVEASHAQKVKIVEETPDEILDSGSTITLSKSGEDMTNIRKVDRKI